MLTSMNEAITHEIERLRSLVVHFGGVGSVLAKRHWFVKLFLVILREGVYTNKSVINPDLGM